GGRGRNGGGGGRPPPPEACPRPALAAVLTASLTARRAVLVRDTSEHAVTRRAAVLIAGDAHRLPFTVVTAELYARLTGRRTVGVPRPLIATVVGSRGALHAEPQECSRQHRGRATQDVALHDGSSFPMPPAQRPGIVRLHPFWARATL